MSHRHVFSSWRTLPGQSWSINRFSAARETAKMLVRLVLCIDDQTLLGRLKHVFTELPRAQSVADVEALLPVACDRDALLRLA